MGQGGTEILGEKSESHRCSENFLLETKKPGTAELWVMKTCWIISPVVQVLCDSKLYEIIRANFERAELYSVVRTTVNSRVNLYYLLSHYSQLTFQ